MTRPILILPFILLAATPAYAQVSGGRVTGEQTPPASSGRSASDLTRDLNSGPPFAVTPRQSTAPAKPSVKPAATDAATTPEPDAGPVEAEPAARDQETLTDPVADALRDAEAPVDDAEPAEATADGPGAEVEPEPEPEIDATPADEAADGVAPDEAAASESAPATVEPETEAADEVQTEPGSEIEPESGEAAAPPPPPPVTPLTAAERAALPFTLALPTGFEIVARPAGPQASVYSVRSEDRTFVMIYAGPSSQFPIYDGQQAQVAGRTSIVVTENGRRRAMEHLFQREAAPREIHVWLASLEGDDAALAEEIAQTVDPR